MRDGDVEREIVLRAQNLRLNFGGVVAADGATLDIFSEEKVAIIGPNGAGKTTFVNLCTGYLTPSEGKVLFGGNDVTGVAPRKLTRRGMVRSFQIPQLFLENTVIENVLLAVAAREQTWNPWKALLQHPHRDDAWQLLERLSLGPLAHRPIRELPEGSRKLVDIALALVLRPKIIFMDEPTSGVSSDEKFTIMDTLVRALESQSVSAVFIEHDMDVVERYADRVAVWMTGKIILQGSPAEVLKHPDVIKNVIGG